MKRFDRIGTGRPAGDNINNCWICGKWQQVAFEHEEPIKKNKVKEIRGEYPVYLNLECAYINQRNTQVNIIQTPEDTKLMMREIKSTKGKRHMPMRHYKMYRMLPIAAPVEKRGNEFAEVLSSKISL